MSDNQSSYMVVRKNSKRSLANGHPHPKIAPYSADLHPSEHHHIDALHVEDLDSINLHRDSLHTDSLHTDNLHTSLDPQPPHTNASAANLSISIVVPTYQEESALNSCLDSLQNQEPPFDVIVSDGGSSDRTVAIARDFHLKDSAGTTSAPRVVQSPQLGRANQMNYGAQQSSSDILLFLHADSQLPTDGLQAIRQTMLESSAIGGRFAVSLDRQDMPYSAIEWGMNARTRITGCFTGDMGIFVWKSVFEQLGGYPQQPLMEDFELSRRMQQLGQVAYLPHKIVTSSRRWHQYGPIKTVALMQAIRVGYSCGVPAHRLAQWYRVIR